MKAILANHIAPGLIDRYLATSGYTGQLADQATESDSPTNLFDPVEGPYGAHGRFDDDARASTMIMLTERHRHVVVGTLAVGLAALVMQAARRLRR